MRSAALIAAAGGLLLAGCASRKTSSATTAGVMTTAWGDPDLQGIWTIETDTPLQRRRPSTRTTRSPRNSTRRRK